MIDFETLEMVGGIAGKALRDVAREVDLTKPGDAELVKNLMSTIYKADCLAGGDDGYSRAGEWYADGNYSRTDYDRGTSYARRRGYARRGMYSRGSIMEHLDAMMQEAETPEQKEKIRRFKEQMGQMM